MSTIRVNSIQHTTANSGNMMLHANGNVSMLTANSTLFIGNTSISNAGISISGSAMSAASGMRNRIINGAMMIDQRNAGASVSIQTTTGYMLDRWTSMASQNSKFSIQQNAGSVTPPAGFSNYLGCTSSSAYSITSGDYFGIYQRIEGFNTADLGWGTANAKTITMSFWVRSSLTGTFGGALRNSASDRGYPFTYTIDSANTWEYKTVTIAGDTTGTWIGATNGIGLSVQFSIGTGSTYSFTAGGWGAYSAAISATGATSVVGTNGATWYITGVQLEAGTVATPFEFRQYGQELALCQRYYFQLTASGSSQGMLAQGYLYATTQWEGIVTFPVDMRTIPTATFTAASTFILRPSNVVPSSVGYYSATGPGTRQMLIYTGHSAFGSAGLGQSLAQVTPGLTGIYFSAEL